MTSLVRARALPHRDVTRRPLRTRNRRFARLLAALLTRAGVSPNAISCASVAFAVVAAVSILFASVSTGTIAAALFVAAAVSIQLRLLANLLDGMVAIEGERALPSGAVFNELPDRLSDVVVLIAAGYGAATTGHAWAAHVGWAAAVLAVLTAYVRALGVSLGTRQHFEGPMAKPERMAVMTLACLVAVVEIGFGWRPRALLGALVVVVIGAVVTVAKRTVLVTREVGEP